MRGYHIALGNWTHVQEEVNDFLNRGYELAGNLIVMFDEGEDGKYAVYYQPMVGQVADTD
jgi:hypothetical protein